ncbi:ribulose-phosphate 3-epimerase [Caldicoprobacter guelmensis]|uniref:ribulose-phosphate 3-epimerase n=1 Tax=Caldicoprobacter guelmensis TaxID=1170224 RepID=UPI0019591692|nr:ribulose-phosphate 3-epimerase [Caldicoprobacter guelmensis]MBM7581903.1 ribulose-phosphate 3-epimerase [Caldicoprobacter guelmensis]
MIKIAPSILSADFSRLGEEVKRLDQGGADMVHIDVMDGHFVPNITIGPLVVKAIRPYTKLPFDVHLMMDNPMTFVDAYVEAGADSITVHAEVLPHLHRAIHYIKSLGVKAAVALNPSTPLSMLEYILGDVDMVLVMTVNPGFGGQEFIPAMMGKLRQLVEMRSAYGANFSIQVDGGIGLYNIRDVVKAGAEVIVAGSAVFGAKDIKGIIEAMRREAIS